MEKPRVLQNSDGAGALRPASDSILLPHSSSRSLLLSRYHSLAPTFITTPTLRYAFAFLPSRDITNTRWNIYRSFPLVRAQSAYKPRSSHSPILRLSSRFAFSRAPSNFSLSLSYSLCDVSLLSIMLFTIRLSPCISLLAPCVSHYLSPTFLFSLYYRFFLPFICTLLSPFLGLFIFIPVFHFSFFGFVFLVPLPVL